MMENSQEYPHLSKAAQRMRSIRNPELSLEDLGDLAAREDMPLMDYLRIYHGDLSSEQMAILWLYVEGGMTKRDIADALGITKQSLQERFQWIKEKLHSAIQTTSEKIV